MKYRVAMWASAGFLVAGFWALFAIATFPSTSERMRDVWTLISLTCPIAIAGMHYPITLYDPPRFFVPIETRVFGRRQSESPGFMQVSPHRCTSFLGQPPV